MNVGELIKIPKCQGISALLLKICHSVQHPLGVCRLSEGYKKQENGKYFKIKNLNIPSDSERRETSEALTPLR